MPLRRRAALALPALLAAGAGRAAGGEGPVTLLVGATPGSAADRWARGFAPFLERHWPRSSVVVRNLPGEGGLAAARILAQAPPDGRLLGAIATPALLARAIEAGEQALLSGLLLLAAVSEDPLVLVGHPGMAESLAALRTVGPDAILGTPPPGSAAQLAALTVRNALPLRLLPFPNAAAARQAVLAGHIPCALLAASEAIVALRDGRLAGLGVAGTERSPLLPEIPTFAEGGVPLVSAVQRGFALPAVAAPMDRQALDGALRAVVADPEFLDQAWAGGTVPRFIPHEVWEPEMRHATDGLARRWAEDPWISRRD